MEIERKFLLNTLPDNLDNYTCYHMEQAYISTNPVIRIRKKSKLSYAKEHVRTLDSTAAAKTVACGTESRAYGTESRASVTNNTIYILTIKSSGMMSREEYELNIDESAYNKLLDKAEGNIITKNRYMIPLDNSLTLELDVFEGIFDGLVIGEIEFSDEESAKKYTPPKYISEEVTFDKRYHNSSLSIMSQQDISNLPVISHNRG